MLDESVLRMGGRHSASPAGFTRSQSFVRALLAWTAQCVFLSLAERLTLASCSAGSWREVRRTWPWEAAMRTRKRSTVIVGVRVAI